MTKRKTTAPAEISERVRLFRFQDKFLTDPMSAEEAQTIMEGYPDEYEIFVPEAPADPIPAADETETDSAETSVNDQDQQEG